MEHTCKFCRESSVVIELGFDSLFICKECVEYLSYLHDEEVFELSPSVAASIFNAHCSLRLLRRSLPNASLSKHFKALKSDLSNAIDDLDLSIKCSEAVIHDKLIKHLDDLKCQLSTLLSLYDV
ncbi:hypothetical protein [Vibrio owensii]|uniref:hypothetical protein n=1 Tax=Vibrio owensii TaxID=696485 RepID=UPI000AF9D97B|nr:hypothetical protein [Vibrio owensii]